MKPVYEIVRAEELRVGDYIGVISNPGSFFASERVSATDKSIESVVIINCKRELRPNEPVLRQLSPERNPEVLMRAYKEVVSVLSHYIPERTPSCTVHEADRIVADMEEYYIQKAISELESEAKRGA